MTGFSKPKELDPNPPVRSCLLAKILHTYLWTLPSGTNSTRLHNQPPNSRPSTELPHKIPINYSYAEIPPAPKKFLSPTHVRFKGNYKFPSSKRQFKYSEMGSTWTVEGFLVVKGQHSPGIPSIKRSHVRTSAQGTNGHLWCLFMHQSSC